MNRRTIQNKITTREDIAPKVALWRAEGKKVGFTSGSFDIIHAGHVSYLQKAKERCDILIAAVNSDASVQSYKGSDRPIIPEKFRVMMMASLESIDYVYTFEERRNRTNLEVIKPTYYIKAGDYKIEQLTSRDVVEKYGGEVMILPMEEGFSTTMMIKKIVKLYGQETEEKKEGIKVKKEEKTNIPEDEAVQAKTELREPQKAVFIDRDGTINEEVEYLHEPEKFKLTQNAGEGIKKFQNMGYKIIIVTTQSGIGLGYFTKEDFYKVNREMFRQLKHFDIIIDKIYFATHSKNSEGKNSKYELLDRARQDLDLDYRKCIVIGDKTGDLDAGDYFKCKKIAVKTGHACNDGQYRAKADYIANDLLDAAEWIENNIDI